MAKKDLQSGLDAILGGAATAATEEEIVETSKKNVSVCFRCSQERIEKIRAISVIKHVSLKDVMEAAIDLALERYEANHGKIETQARGDIKNIFD